MNVLGIYKKKKKIGEEEVEVDPQNISSAVKEEDVDVGLIRKYFNSDGWLQVKQVLEERKKLPSYCNVCSVDADEKGTRAVYCDSCCEWYHYKCVNIFKKPTGTYWFCKNCKN